MTENKDKPDRFEDEVTDEELDNQLDARIHFTRVLGKYMRSLDGESPPREELRTMQKWKAHISPWITRRAKQRVEKKLSLASQMIRRGKHLMADKALSEAHEALVNARPELYFPAQKTAKQGFTTVKWTEFMDGDLTQPETFKSEFVDDRRTDFLYEKWMYKIRQRIRDADDDYLLMTVGDTGTGKSTLSLHGLEYYTPRGESVDLDFVGLDKQSHADALKRAKEAPRPRYCDYDEAPVYGRNAMTSYNKDLIETYDKIRGANIFNVWNNPRLDMIDEPFLDGVLDAVVVVLDKSVDKPRRYAVFSSQQILEFYEEEGDLTLDVLEGHKDDAVWIGWFRPREDELWERYTDLKENAMSSQVDEFFEEYGDSDVMSANEAADKIDVHPSTFSKYLTNLSDDGVLTEGVDYKQAPSGAYKVPHETMEEVKEAIENAHK